MSMIAVESQGATEAPSHLQAAAPFLLTAVVILVGAALALFVIARAEKEYEGIVDEYENSLNATKEFKADTPKVERLTGRFVSDPITLRIWGTGSSTAEA